MPRRVMSLASSFLGQLCQIIWWELMSTWAANSKTWFKLLGWTCLQLSRWKASSCPLINLIHLNLLYFIPFSGLRLWEIYLRKENHTLCWRSSVMLGSCLTYRSFFNLILLVCQPPSLKKLGWSSAAHIGKRMNRTQPTFPFECLILQVQQGCPNTGLRNICGPWWALMQTAASPLQQACRKAPL